MLALVLFLAGYPPQSLIDDFRSKLPFECVANTKSMYPDVTPGDMLGFYASDFDSLEIGDWVLGGTVPYNVLASHAIIGGNKTKGFIVKGTGNARPDLRRLTKENYVGKWKLIYKLKKK